MSGSIALYAAMRNMVDGTIRCKVGAGILMKPTRRHFSGGEKVAILRRHLIDSVPISDICTKHDLQPTVFYRWQKRFFENGAAAFDGHTDRADPRVLECLDLSRSQMYDHTATNAEYNVA
jgi:transposase-like protein